MPKTYAVTVSDDITLDLERSNAAVSNGGVDGLLSKVVLDAVQDIRRSEAETTPVVEPDPSDVTVIEE